MFIDTHLHLDDPRFAEDFSAVIQRAVDSGVEAMINVGTDLSDSEKSHELFSGYDFIYTSAGVHPHAVAGISGNLGERLKKIASRNKVKAVGEIGLDYFRRLSPEEEQKRLFREQLRFALDAGLPVIVHCRDAGEDVCRILAEENIARVGGVMHCFSGDEVLAKKVLDMGLHISFAGQITYPNASRLREVLRTVPVEKLLLETDAPYLPPRKMRGKRNEPSFIGLTAAEIASVKGMTTEEIGAITTRTAKKLFGLS